MGILDQGEPPIKGELTIDLKEFPQELLNTMMDFARAGRMPVMSIEIPRIFMTDGAVLETSWERSTITLSFAAHDITIKEV